MLFLYEVLIKLLKDGGGKIQANNPKLVGTIVTSWGEQLLFN